MAALSKITSRGQTTVPQEIRDALKSAPGDLLAWNVDAAGTVVVRRVTPLDVAYLGAVEGTLSEWTTAEDQAAYGDL